MMARIAGSLIAKLEVRDVNTCRRRVEQAETSRSVQARYGIEKKYSWADYFTIGHAA
jgi:hypothetical protein